MIVVWVLVAVGLAGLLLLGVLVAGHLRGLTRERDAVQRDVAVRTAPLRALMDQRAMNRSRRRDEGPASP